MSDRKRIKLDEEAVAEADEKVVEDLRQLQSDLDKVNDQLADRICELEQQYVQQRAPIYEKRAAVCSKIPHFWSTALRHHPLTSRVINEDDEDMLHHLTDLLVKDNADIRTGCYDIVLRFNDNPYFTNKELVKSLTIKDDGSLVTSCTPVQWRDSKEGETAKALKQARRADKNRLSFFDWLCEPEETFDHDETDDVAEAIKQEIWTDPLQLYLNQGDEGDDEAEEEDEDEGEEEDEDEGPTPDEEDL